MLPRKRLSLPVLPTGLPSSAGSSPVRSPSRESDFLFEVSRIYHVMKAKGRHFIHSACSAISLWHNSAISLQSGTEKSTAVYVLAKVYIYATMFVCLVRSFLKTSSLWISSLMHEYKCQCKQIFEHAELKHAEQYDALLGKIQAMESKLTSIVSDQSKNAEVIIFRVLEHKLISL
jgi:hypothetical protein